MNNNTTFYSLFLAQQSAVLQYCRIYLSLCHKHVRVSLLIHCFAYHHFCYVCGLWCIQYSHNKFLFYFAFLLSLAFYSSSFVLMLFIFSVIISRVLIRCHSFEAPFLLLFLLLISIFFICCCSSYAL